MTFVDVASANPSRYRQRTMAGRKRHQYEHVVSWGDVRRQLLSQWHPDMIPSEDNSFQRHFAQLWDDLIQVEQIAVWRSVTALSGQTIESMLKLRLLREGFTPQDMTGQNGTIGRLIDRSRAVGLFEPPREGLTIGGSIYSAQKARNLASHASPWLQHPTEVRATLSIAYVVALSGYLFRRPAPGITDAVLENTDESVTEVGSQRLALAIAEQSPAVPQLSDMFVRGCSTYELVKLLRRMKKESWPRGPILEALRENLGNVIHSAGNARVSQLYDLCPMLATIGLRGPATRSLSSLLPCDPSSLAYLMDRSPNSFARYLYLCKTADPDMFKTVTGGPALKPVVEMLVTSAKSRSVALPNLCNIIDQFGQSCVAEVLSRAGPELRSWVADESPANAVALLRSIRLIHQSNEVAQDLILLLKDRCRSSNWELLSSVPLRLHQLDIIDHSVSDSLLADLLDRMPVQDDWQHVQRVLADIVSFSVKWRSPALQVIRKAIREESLRSDIWNYLSLCGTLIAAGESIGADVELDNTHILTTLAAVDTTVQDRYFVASLDVSRR